MNANIIVPTVLVCALGACVEHAGWYGANIDIGRLGQVTPGKSTLAEVVGILEASPNERTSDSNGVTTALWYRVSGILSEPTTLRCNYMVTAHFDVSGRLIDVQTEKFQNYEFFVEPQRCAKPPAEAEN